MEEAVPSSGQVAHKFVSFGKLRKCELAEPIQYNGNLKEQISVYKKMSGNLKTREKQCLPFDLYDQLFVTVRD